MNSKAPSEDPADILKKHISRFNTPENNRKPMDQQLTFVLEAAHAAMEEYASQFKAEIAASRDLNHELILKLAAAAPQFKSKDNIPEPDSQKQATIAISSNKSW